MIVRLLFYGVIFLVLFSFEAGFLSAFPAPWSWLPIMPALALWFLHQKGSRIGVWYLLGWGIGSDLLNRNPWGLETVTAIVMIVFWATFASRMFTARSLYGFLAFLLSEWFLWSFVEISFRFFGAAPAENAFLGFLSFSIFRGLGLLLLAAFLFLIDVRIREAHVRL